MPTEPQAPATTVPMDDLAQTRLAVIHAKAKAREWTSIAEAGMASIKERVGEADQGTVNGLPVVRRMTRVVTRVNAKQLRADLPEQVLAPYLVTSTETRYELLED